MKDFSPNNQPLWNIALAEATQGNPAEHNKWDVRQKAMDFYLSHGGDFRDSEPQACSHEEKLALVNNLRNCGVIITASLMARSLDHQWRQYVGHEVISLEDLGKAVSHTLLPLIIRPQGYFGIKASAFGYELMLPNARDTRVMVPRRIGFTLMSLSRALSLRETKYRDQPAV